MSGTRPGGLKATRTIYATHGKDFYKRIGARGGAASNKSGFYGDPDRAAEMGRKGGLAKGKAPGTRYPNRTFKFLNGKCLQPIVRKI